MRTLLVPLLAAAIALTAVACGSETAPEDEVREDAIAALSATDTRPFCRTMVTDHFLEEVFGGDLRSCIDSSVVEDKPGKPVVSAVALQGEEETRALVAVRVQGGEADGVAGHLRFAKVDDEWKMDRLENDYLRSVFDVGIGRIDEGAVSTPEMQACMSKQFASLGDAELRSFTFDNLADPKAGEEQAIALAKRCRLPLAEYAADTFADALAESDDADPVYVKCIREELTALLLLTNITGELIVDKPSFAALAALEGLAAGAKQNCGKG